jgi:hypothetical protein
VKEQRLERSKPLLKPSMPELERQKREREFRKAELARPIREREEPKPERERPKPEREEPKPEREPLQPEREEPKPELVRWERLPALRLTSAADRGNRRIRETHLSPSDPPEASPEEGDWGLRG